MEERKELVKVLLEKDCFKYVDYKEEKPYWVEGTLVTIMFNKEFNYYALNFIIPEGMENSLEWFKYHIIKEIRKIIE